MGRREDAEDATEISRVAVVVRFDKPDGSSVRKHHQWYPSENCTNTYIVDGIAVEVLCNEILFDTNDISGTWILDRVELSDSADNYKSYFDEDLDSLGIQRTFEVVKDGSSTSDSDGDGVSDLVDNCPAISNSDQLDFDSY